MNEYQLLAQLGNPEREYLYPTDGYHLCDDGDDHYDLECIMNDEGDDE